MKVVGIDFLKHTCGIKIDHSSTYIASLKDQRPFQSAWSDKKWGSTQFTWLGKEPGWESKVVKMDGYAVKAPSSRRF